MDIKIAARLAVQRAVKRGDLIRPKICQNCGSRPGKAKNGAPLIQGHHPDYSYPLKVEWICVKCHRKETPSALGEDNGQSKLTTVQVLAIKKSPLGCRRLATKYGVDKKNIQYIRRGETWKHV